MKKSFLFMALVLVLNVQPSFAEEFERFERLDTNGDNQISLQEFSDANAERIARVFDRIDSNEDGYLDQSELQVAREARAERRRGRDQ